MNILRKIASLNWVANVLFPLTVILTEVMCVYPWLTHIGRWPVFIQERTPLSLASLILLLGGSFFVTRFFIRRRWSLRWTRLSIIACGLAAIITVLRIEYSVAPGLLDGKWFIYISRLLVNSYSHPNQVVAALLFGVYLWWRGIGLGYSPLFFENIYRSFSIGFVTLVVLILAWGTDPQDISMSTIGIYVAGFFFFGLSALALAKLKGTQEQNKEGGVSAVFNGRWLSIIIVVITGIVLVGIGIASIFSTQFLSVLGQLFDVVSGLLYKVLYYISAVGLAIVGFLMAVSFAIIQSILNMLQGEIPTEVSSSANVTAIQELKQNVARTASPETTLIIKWILFALVIAAVVFLFGRAILHYGASRQKEDVEEIHESLWSWDGFLIDLRLFFSLLWQHFRSRIKTVIPVSAGRHSQHHRMDIGGRLGIREIYQHLLQQASQIGVTRRYQETPYEYCKRLGQVVPEGSAPLIELTHIYVNIRYGDLAAEAKQVDYANDLWETIQKLLTRPETDQAE